MCLLLAFQKLITRIDHVKDLHIVMLKYNLIEYNKNYKKATGSLRNYYRDEPNGCVVGENNKIDYPIKDSKSFDYKISITGKPEGINTAKEVKIAVSLKYLSIIFEEYYICH